MQTVTVEKIRQFFHAHAGVWGYMQEVIDILEEKMQSDATVKENVDKWLSGGSKFSTVFLRDEIMETIRHDPRIVEIGKQFNPSTEWDNTWIPLDTAGYNVRWGLD
jgi:hypothetical protein